jgi:hypothetical protein
VREQQRRRLRVAEVSVRQLVGQAAEEARDPGGDVDAQDVCVAEEQPSPAARTRPPALAKALARAARPPPRTSTRRDPEELRHAQHLRRHGVRDHRVPHPLGDRQTIAELENLIDAVEDYNAEVRDEDIEADLDMLAMLRANMIAAGIGAPRERPRSSDPWPAE